MVNTTSIGISIQKCRESKGISKKELAQISGVAYQTIYIWENGWAFPRTDLLICIADALGVTLDELVGRTAEK